MSLLRPVGDGPGLVVCNTCRVSAEAPRDARGATGGALLFAYLQIEAGGDPRLAELSIEDMPCLFNCTQHCSIHLRAPGKIGYVLGRFEPTREAARAILDYALAYMESPEGSVPYRQWPEGVKGPFIVRTPPVGQVVRS